MLKDFRYRIEDSVLLLIHLQKCTFEDSNLPQEQELHDNDRGKENYKDDEALLQKFIFERSNLRQEQELRDNDHGNQKTKHSMTTTLVCQAVIPIKILAPSLYRM